jgi:hypothetical protein
VRYAVAISTTRRSAAPTSRPTSASATARRRRATSLMASSGAYPLLDERELAALGERHHLA